MSATHLKQLCEDTFTRLKKVSMELERFLNKETLSSLVAKSGDPEEYEIYYRHFISDLRHLLVYSENAYERLGVCLRRAKFNAAYAEEVLSEVYHNCVNNFYYPKGEGYDESVYNGQEAIIFRKEITPELRQLMLVLSQLFSKMRSDLQVYETGYLQRQSLQTAR